MNPASVSGTPRDRSGAARDSRAFPDKPAFALLLGMSVERGLARERPVSLPQEIGAPEVQISLQQGSAQR
jgi:hypothetical protein